MSNNTDERLFAYGKNEYEDCECPAVAAGYVPEEVREESLTALIEVYDNEAGGGLFGKGKIWEHKAEKSWGKAIEFLKESDTHDAEASIEWAEKIANELGWDNL